MNRSHIPAQGFPPTRWTLIVKAGERDQNKRSQALEDLCQIYWPPVYAFLRTRGNNYSEAEDLTQSFFAKFLRLNDFAKADREKGKLRTFLMRAVTNFSASEYRDQNRQKRGGEVTIVSLDHLDAEGRPVVIEPEDGFTPEKIFERQWALTVLSKVLSTLESRYVEKEQGELFRQLSFSITPESTSRSYAEIGKDLGMKENSVKVAAFRLRQRYAETLRAVVGDTLAEGESVETELQLLLAAFD